MIFILIRVLVVMLEQARAVSKFLIKSTMVHSYVMVDILDTVKMHVLIYKLTFILTVKLSR